VETKWSRYYSFDEDGQTRMKAGRTLYGALKDAAYLYSERTAVEYNKRKISFKNLLDDVDHFASVLSRLGVGVGDCVTLCCQGMPHTIIALYAANKLGAAVSMISGDTKHKDFIDLSASTNSGLCIISAEYYTSIREVLKETSFNRIIICRRNDFFSFVDRILPQLWPLLLSDITSAPVRGGDIPEDNTSGIYLYSDLMKNPSEFVPEEKDPLADAVYFHSGVAAGGINTVAISSEALNAEASVSSVLFMNKSLRVFSFVRYAFSFGLCFGIHSVLMAGCTVLVNMNTDPRKLTYALNVYAPDAIIGYPQMLDDLIDNRTVKNETLRKISFLYSGGNVMTGSQYHRLCDYLEQFGSGKKVVRLYGITETSSVSLFNPPFLDNDRILGIPLPGIRVRIVNPDTNAEAMYGSTGVISINTPSAMTGYLGQTDDNLSVMRDFGDGSKWILTGDFGHEDEDGLIYFDGSRRRLFDRGGTHVYPQLIEKEIHTVFGVEDCCVIPVSRGCDIIVKAVIKPETEYFFDNERLNRLKEEIDSLCKMELSAPMRPDEYDFVAYMPTTSYGKADYNKIMEMYGEENDEQEDKQDTGSDFSGEHKL